MASFTRGTTPTIRIRITKPTNFDMTRISKCHLTIEQVGTGKELVFENPVIDTEEKTVSVHLTQEQALLFKSGSVEVQLKIKLSDGNVCVCNILKGGIDRILEETIL